MDAEVIRLAVLEGRVLLTEDKDFGQLVYASGTPSAGVILLRYPTAARAAIAQALLDLAQEKADQLASAFVVVQPGRVRISPGPGPPGAGPPPPATP